MTVLLAERIVDGWVGRSCGVHLSVTIGRDSGWVLRVAAGLFAPGQGLLRRASENLVELDFEACRARVLGVRNVDSVRRRSISGQQESA
jgi:hypothetical protein